MRIVVAAFGNELRGDDGFGIAVLRRLESTHAAASSQDNVELLEVGTGGLWLAQQLLSRCDRLIVIDAMSRGHAPGTISVMKVDDVEPVSDVDMHLAVPSRALGVARALGALPAETFMVGCEPDETEELTTELSSTVKAAIGPAAQHVRSLIAGCP